MSYELCSCLLKHPCSGVMVYKLGGPMFWSYAPVYLSWGDIHVLELCSCLLKSYAPVYLSWGDIHVL